MTRLQVTDGPLRTLQFLVVALALASAFGWGAASWRADTASAAVTAQKNADLIREYTLRLLDTRRSLLGAVTGYLERRGGAPFSDRDLHDYLAASEALLPSSFGLAIIDPAGNVVTNSRRFPTHENVGERDYLKRHAEGAPIYVDRLRLRPRNVDALVITQRLPGEPYRGVFASPLDVNAITDFLQRIAPEGGASASLLRTDGKLLVRNVPGDPVQLDGDSPAMAMIAGGGTGVYEATAQSDGITRIYASSAIPGLPLVANFGVSMEQLSHDWRRGYAVALALIVSIAALAWTALWQARRRLAAEVGLVQLAEARKSAELREAMLREMNHRVKNSLQSVQALILLRQRQEIIPFAEEISQRVSAIADIHQLLYASPDQTRINLKDFLERLCGNESLFPPERAVKAACDLDDVVIGFGQATPLALIVVELVTNALKHAFPAGTGGTVRIGLRDLGGEAEITVADDGVGMTAAATRRSGLKIVHRMVEQVNGRLETTVDGGTRFSLRFVPTDAV